MTAAPRAGRPKASSTETLAEAACELFLERGFEATSIADIASRAGVSRSSFFNYFASKSAILWAGLDERLDAFETRVAQRRADAAADVRHAASALAHDFAPDSLAIAIVNAGAMGLEAELDREASLRRSRIARAVAGRVAADGADRLGAEVVGAAWGGGVLAAIEAWAHDGAGRTSLERFVARAAAAVSATTTAHAGDAASSREPGPIE